MRSARSIVAGALLALLSSSLAWAAGHGGGGGGGYAHGAGSGYHGSAGYSGHGYYGHGYYGHGYYGRGYGGWYGWGGVYLGGPWWGWPGYYPYYAPYSYPYDAGYAVAPSSPPVFIENAPAPRVTTSAGSWYYCRDPQGYYPYVRNCTGAWEPVPAQPPNLR